jgi:hypothetical protein
MSSLLEKIQFITDNFGSRIAVSEGDRKTIEYLENDFLKLTPNVETESFRVEGRSVQNYFIFGILCYLISIVCYFFLPPLSLVFSFIILLNHYLAWYKQINLLDILTVREETKNIIAKFHPKKESRGIIIFSAHHDSEYHMPILQKDGRFVAFLLKGTLVGIYLLLVSSIWKTITLGISSIGILEIVSYSLGSFEVSWFILPDIFFVLSLFGFCLNSYLFVNIVSNTEVIGANDNLSAVVILLALGEYLQNNPLENWEVRLISFGAEETIKSIGSSYYVENHLEELENAVIINIESSGTGEYIAIWSEEKFFYTKHDKKFVELIQKLAKKNGYELIDIKPSIGYSDASHFTRKKIKATTISRIGGPILWHSLEDKVENLNEKSMQDSFKLTKILLQEFDKLEKI